MHPGGGGPRSSSPQTEREPSSQKKALTWRLSHRRSTYVLDDLSDHFTNPHVPLVNTACNGAIILFGIVAKDVSSDILSAQVPVGCNPNLQLKNNVKDSCRKIRLVDRSYMAFTERFGDDATGSLGDETDGCVPVGITHSGSKVGGLGPLAVRERWLVFDVGHDGLRSRSNSGLR